MLSGCGRSRRHGGSPGTDPGAAARRRRGARRRSRGARRREEAGRRQDARHHRAHATGARRQSRPDRIRDRRRAAGQVRAQGRGPCAGKRTDDRRFQRRQSSFSCRLKSGRPPAGGQAGRLRRHRSSWTPHAERASPASSRTSRGSCSACSPGRSTAIRSPSRTPDKPKRRRAWPMCSMPKVRPTLRCGCSSIGTRTCRSW